MAGFLLFSCRAAGMRNLINSGGRWVVFPREAELGQNAAFLAFLRILRSKTGKKQPGAAPEDLKP